jgi:hypothetical protein
MKLPRDLSGRELASSLCKHWKYMEVSQEGSHLLLATDVRVTNESQSRFISLSRSEP